MRAFLLILLACLVGFGAGDDWAKVKALKTGAELRVFKKGRVTKETTTKNGVGPDGSPTSSTSTGYNIGGKPDFETVYKRLPATPKK